MSPHEKRLALKAAGFSPIPCDGKRPTLVEWQAPTNFSAEEMARWSGRNTGIQTAYVPCCDIDITLEGPAIATEELVKGLFAGRGKMPVRIGNAPKRALLFRTAEPFPKRAVRFIAPDGSKQKIEILGAGQQVVVDGPHPDTGDNYIWLGDEPWTIKYEDLPEIDEEEAGMLLDLAADMLKEQFGFVRDNSNGVVDDVNHEPVYGVPVDAEARLAAMRYQGEGNACINETLKAVIPSMLRTSMHPDDVLDRVVNAVMEAGAGLGWDRDAEVKRVAASISSAYKMFLKDYDHSTGVIPNWLPGAFHEAWTQALHDGRRPGLSRNRVGFAVWSWSDKSNVITLPTSGNGSGESPGEEQAAPRGYRFKLVSFADLKPGPEPLYLVDELIPVAGLVDVWGKAKCYKSFWTLDLMLHVALGWEYRDRCVHQGAVVYCAFEGAHGYKKRVEALRRHYSIEAGADVPLYVMPGQANLIAEHRVLIADIAAQLGEVKPVAVVLDTLNKSLVGSENKDVDMGAYVRAAEAIRDRFGCVVIIVHHCGYDDTRPRGHSSLPGAVDAQLAVVRAENIITVTVEMMRDGPEDTQVVSAAESIEVGEDQNGKTLTSLVIVPSEADPAGSHQGWARGLSVFHAALKAALSSHGEVFQPEPGVLPVRAVSQWFVRDRFYKTYAEAEEDEKKRQAKMQKAFVRALADAQGKGVIRVRRDGDRTMVWLPEHGEGL